MDEIVELFWCPSIVLISFWKFAGFLQDPVISVGFSSLSLQAESKLGVFFLNSVPLWFPKS